LEDIILVVGTFLLKISLVQGLEVTDQRLESQYEDQLPILKCNGYFNLRSL